MAPRVNGAMAFYNQFSACKVPSVLSPHTEFPRPKVPFYFQIPIASIARAHLLPTTLQTIPKHSSWVDGWSG